MSDADEFVLLAERYDGLPVLKSDRARGAEARVLGQAQFGFIAPPHAFDKIAFGLQIVGKKQREIRISSTTRIRSAKADVWMRAIPARVAHASPPAASMSLSISGRRCGRSEGMDRPLTR